MNGVYYAAGGDAIFVQGKYFETTIADTCVENPIKPVYSLDESCSDDPDNCDSGLSCA